MPTATRTFRVFVSSTFEDLKAERDVLQHDVFPRLRKLCEANNARFQAIDLRWGVRDEAALDQQTMEICLREIERCQQTGIKPNFIVLLGERYGWRPLPARIEAEEFKKVRGRAADADQRLIDDWYERDDNAVPQEFLLKPRTGEFADRERWAEVEQKLHRILRQAARQAGLAPESLVKYEASATHQEILKGLGQSEEDRKHVVAFFREPAEGATVDPELEALKDDLRHKLPEGDVRLFRMGEIEKLCGEVEESLKKVILDETGRFTSRDALDLEIEAHDRFAADRCRIFVGRGDALTAIADYLGGPERRPLVLHGESGSGKSAVMAKASELYMGPGQVIRRFIGASPESASGHALLTSLCRQIAPGDTPVDYYQLERAFQERLATATAEHPLVLFIDALDQLSASDPARAAIWLPAELPPFVKVVVSTTDDWERLPAGMQIPLERMTATEGGQVLDVLLRAARRTLQPGQREKMLTHFGRCGLPLYLKLAAEESRLWKSFSPPDACRLGEGIAGVIDTLFDRLASNANHGPVLVERSLGYLAAARYGLTEGEMLDVLTADDTVWNDFDRRKHHEVSERRLPVVVWSRLSLDLEPYLTERAAPGGTVIAFYHRQLAERVAERFLAGDEARARHGDLANYFASLNLGLRQIGELPWQLAEAAEWRRLCDLLAKPDFFVSAWDLDEYDLKTHWRRVETSSPFRMEEAYWPALDAPDDADGDLVMVTRLAGLFRDSGHFDIAKRCCRKVLSALRGVSTESAGGILPGIYLELAYLEFATNNREAGERWLERGQSLPGQVKDPHMTLKVLFEAGLQAKKQGRWSQAMQLYDQGIGLARRLNDHKMLARLYNNLGNVEKNLGELERASQHFQSGLEVARAAADPETESRCLHGLGDTAQMLGDLQAAQRWYGAALEIKDKLGDLDGMAKCILGLGNIAFRQGDLEGAEVNYNHALQLAPDSKELCLTVYEAKVRALLSIQPGEDIVSVEVEELLWRCYGLRRDLGLEIPEDLRMMFGRGTVEEGGANEGS
jgi:tetratricopeptide (TPR) repeat protein